MDKFIIPLTIALQIKSKFAVFPLIIHPIAIKPSYLLKSFDITCGISNDPGTLITLISLTFLDFNSLIAPFSNLLVMSSL